MIHFKLKSSLVILLFVLITIPVLHAQEAISAVGNKATGMGGTASYTIGQTAYHINSSSDYSVSEGAQQPYEIFIIKDFDEANGISLSVYPNPVVDKLILNVNEIKTTGMSYQIFNMAGSILGGKNITERKTSISMAGLTPATYFVKVSHNNKLVKTFKIVKN